MTRTFVEDKQFEQGNSSDEFYATGSSPAMGNDMWTFAKSLRDKEQIRVSFPVSTSTRMLANSSSIYYFNPKNGSWSIPQKSMSDHVGPWKNVAMRGPSNPGSWFIEDTISFDYKGNSLASGSLDIMSDFFNSINFTSVPQKILKEGKKNGTSIDFSLDRQSEICQDDYPKSFQRNDNYDASSECVFILDNQYPFLIEKFVIEIPVCLGNSWFKDKTTECWTTSSAGDYTWENPAGIFNSYMNDNPSVVGGDKKGVYYDQGGPGLTFALLSQKNYGTSSIRDLIGRSFVTHDNDIGKDPTFFQYNFQESRNQQTSGWETPSLDIIGMEEEDVDCIVGTPVNNLYTGSLKIKCESSISNGCKVFVKKSINYVGKTQQEVEDDIYEQLGSLYEKTDSTNIRLLGVDAFGRGMTGFSPSGGSIFGGEFNIGSFDRVKNPFYISDEAKRRTLSQQGASLWNSGGQFYVELKGTVFVGKKKSSPYLLNPGEKLILSVSKTRPATSRFKANIPPDPSPPGPPVPRIIGRADVLSSSYYHDLGGYQGHDVQLNTGSINITFYGSYVRAGNSYVP